MLHFDEIPVVEAQGKPVKVVTTLNEANPNSHFALIAVRRAHLKDNRDAYVRVVAGMPLTATGKVNKQPLRGARWETEDAVWLREGNDGSYRRMTSDDAAALRAEFDTYGRAHVLDAM